MRKPGLIRPSTRDRILSVTLELLNSQGSDQVTTRRIAEAAGINEGNLYYHFRTREALFVALFDRFEAAALAAMQPGAGEGPADYAAVLERWFGLTWTYRFLFRDALSIQTAAPPLRRALRRLSVRLTRAMSATLAGMERAGLLSVPPGARDRLLANIAIVSSYWVSFLTMQRGLSRLTPAHLQWGRDQVRSLYAPYMTDRRPSP